MKQSILERISALGGNIKGITGECLQEDFKSLSFNTVLYPKREGTPWAKVEEQELIIGITEVVNKYWTELAPDKDVFFNRIIERYFHKTEESYGQTYFRNDIFTPFLEGSKDFEEWDGEWEESDFQKVIIGNKMELMFIGYSSGFPDNHFICLSDPDINNPIVYGTDHEVFFDEITRIGTLEEYFNSFITPEELVNALNTKL